MAAFLNKLLAGGKWLAVCVAIVSCEQNRLEVVEAWDNNAPREAWEVSPSGEYETWFSWHRNGIKAEEMPFINGLPNGTYRKWSVTGFVMEQGNYKDSLREGKWTLFAKERVPSRHGFYKKGLEHGKWTYFNLNGKVSAEQFYDNGRPIGVWKKFQNDILIEEDSCFETNETGFFKKYGKDGKIFLYQECKSGKLDGVSMEYYPGGSLQKIGHFKNNLKTDLWVEYFANGNVRKIEHWISSMRNGKWIRFGESGEMLSVAEFTDGSGFFEDTLWKNSRIDGEVRIKLKEGEYTRVEKWENGVKQSTTDYHKDLPGPVALGFWKNGAKNGAWKTWYRSGILKDSLNFRDGEQIGEQFYYDSTGRLYKKEVIQGAGAKIVEMMAR